MNNLLVSISSTSSTGLLLELKQHKYLCLEGMNVTRDTNAYVFNENIFLGLVEFVFLYFASHSLNSDGQQFHHYQENEHLTLTSNHRTYKLPRHMTL